VKKIFQKEWFGINFSDIGVPLSMRNVAGVDFYSAFYREFYTCYHGYKELPENWRSFKDELVRHIGGLVCDNYRILSIGCGVGYVESELCGLNKSLDIVAIEPGIDTTRWVDERVKVLHGLFPEALENKYNSSQFDLVYASGIDYVFDNESYEDFLNSLVDYGVHDFLMTEIFIAKHDLLSLLKEMIKNILSFLGVRKGYQFWGYLREVDEHIEYLKKAGFSEFETGIYDHGAYWIRARR
jgi:hypothetical protein